MEMPHLAKHEPPFHSRLHRELVLRSYDEISLRLAYNRSQGLPPLEHHCGLERKAMIATILWASFGESA